MTLRAKEFMCCPAITVGTKTSVADVAQDGRRARWLRPGG